MDTIDKILKLMDTQKVSAAELTREAGITNGLVTQWKKRLQNPSNDSLLKISKYFSVPLSFLTGAPPFDVWETINENRNALLHYLYLPRKLQSILIGDQKDLNKWGMIEFVRLIDSIIESIRISSDGDFDIELKEWVREAKIKEEKSIDYLSENGIPADDEEVYLPVWGDVAAGMGALAEDNILWYEPIAAADIKGKGDCFWLRVKGNSMEPMLLEGDLVLVQKCTSVDCGRYAVIRVDGIEGVIKQVKYGINWIELHSVNPEYEVRRFDGPDVLRLEVVGLVLQSKRKFI